MTTTPPPPSPAAVARREASERALRRFAARRGRLMGWYLAAVATVVVLITVAVTLFWTTGEAANAHLKVAAKAATILPRTALPPMLSTAWISSDATAIGQPFVGGTVITYSKHTVTGRDARTGGTVWSYTRTNATVCQVAQQQGKAMALYSVGGNCDQLSAFDAATGRRAWQRTLDESMTPIDGQPSVISLPDTLFVWTPEVIYAIAVSSAKCLPESGSDCGYDYWSFEAQDGCRIAHVVPGMLGVLISERCTNEDRLLLRDRYQNSDSTHTRIIWTLQGNSAVPIAADYFLAAVQPGTSRLEVLNRNKGTVQSTSTMRPAPNLNANISRQLLPGGELVQIGDTCYAFLLGSEDVRWSKPTVTLPSLDPDDGNIVYLPSPAGVAVLSSKTGQRERVIPGPATTGTTYLTPMGSGFLAGGSRTTALR
ncbi:MAG TPA: PQQ-binding-like beta-propeller repeat protein [Jatrophihabitantaceae bacterium]|nr:PQQ-binding-like beta-propeller repeat protein [Jatrophihabitantaceae bacterium]